MNAPPALLSRTPSPAAPSPVEGELGLAALLDLFAPEEHAAVARSAFRSDGARLRACARNWVRRATEWGAGPGGAWRAW